VVFLQQLASVMGNNVDLAQLGVSNINFEQVRLDLWCAESSKWVPGSCEKGTKEFFNDFLDNSNPSSASDNVIKTNYVIKMAKEKVTGAEHFNWRAKYAMPLWAPVVMVVGLIALLGVILFVSALFCSKSGVGNVKF
jgi:hypothetical protein